MNRDTFPARRISILFFIITIFFTFSKKKDFHLGMKDIIYLLCTYVVAETAGCGPSTSQCGVDVTLTSQHWTGTTL